MPAGVVASVVTSILETQDRPSLIVTDVAGVKGSIVDHVLDPRFIGGHPMAGSGLRCLSGARADLFAGSTWVLTPTDRTSAAAYSALHGVLREIGANVVAIRADEHDRLVAVASHVPHLLAGSLMNEASQVAEQDAVLLQLAGRWLSRHDPSRRRRSFDLARYPLREPRGGRPRAWRHSRADFVDFVEALLDDGREVILDSLLSAASARRQLPGRALSSDDLAYLRVKVSDETRCARQGHEGGVRLLVNIYGH